MKRIIALLMVLLMVFALGACQDTGKSHEEILSEISEKNRARRCRWTSTIRRTITQTIRVIPPST